MQTPSPCRILAWTLIVFTLTAANVPAYSQSNDGEANEAYRDAIEAFVAKNFERAVTLMKRVVELRPIDDAAWNDLGRAYQGWGKQDEAIAGFHKSIELNPQTKFAYNNLGMSLQAQEKIKDAELAFRKQLEINPKDKFALRNLGAILLRENQPKEAVEVLEPAHVAEPLDFRTTITLVQAYQEAGQPEKGQALLKNITRMPTDASIVKPIDPFVGFLESSVHKPEETIRDAKAEMKDDLKKLELMNMQDPGSTEIKESNRIAMLWAAMGDAYLRAKQLEPAERYLKAAWVWAHSPVIADRLGQTYEQEDKKDEAIRAYCFALGKFTGFVYEPSRPRLAALVGDEQVDSSIRQSRMEWSKEMGVQLPIHKEQAIDAQASYRIIFKPNGAIVAKFTHGTQGSELLGPILEGTKYPVIFPDPMSVSVVRQAEIFCRSNTCTLTFAPIVGMPN